LKVRSCANLRVFFLLPLGKRTSVIGDKSAPLRDGLVTSAVASNPAQNARAMELSSQVLFFAVHAVLCYCAGAKLLCALELLRQAYLLLRFVLRFCVFLQLGLCRSHWTGSIKVRYLGAAAACVLCFYFELGVANRIGVAASRLP